MKKCILLLIVFTFGFTISSFAQYYETAKEAAGEAQVICNQFGQKAKAGTKDDHSGAISYGSNSSYGSSTTGGQNITRAGGEIEGSVATRVKAGANLQYERKGEQENSQSSTASKKSGYLYYKCEDE